MVGVIEKVSEQSLLCGRRWCVQLGVAGGEREQLPLFPQRLERSQGVQERRTSVSNGSPPLLIPAHTSHVLERKLGQKRQTAPLHSPPAQTQWFAPSEIQDRSHRRS